ncbi:MAG TPA: tRNA lysidine(34) synthetase TilS [Gammaproteobacteria bacterium]|nr:tRNA lysidine(34) synthetase TilS [Gammaproteobacteria bacterium]
MTARVSPASEPFLAQLHAAVERLIGAGERPPMAVAFSGGVDSTVLLAALARSTPRAPLRALHVDHGLHPDSAAWAAHCAKAAGAFGVPFAVERVTVDRASGLGLEAAAREARYRVLEQALAPGELLLTAHHADDQLETVLLRLARGSGVRGLRGIVELAPFGRGLLGRPLLSFTRAELRAQAEDWRLEWLEDPANADWRHDRSFLRARVVPELRGRWPAVAASAVRLAQAASDAEAILESVAAQDLAGAGDPRRIPRSALATLPAPRQRNLLREALRRAELPPPSAERLEALRHAVLDAGSRARPCVRWPGGEGRVFREHLYLMAPLPPASPDGDSAVLQERSEWSGPEGTLSFELADSGAGLPASWLHAGLELRFRAGGERFHALGSRRERPLKDWLHEAAVVPWMRDRVPLLYRGKTLVAVADLCLAASTASADEHEPRWRVRWTSHPAEK